MRVLLATTSLCDLWLNHKGLDTANVHYPVGLGYLHAYLAAAGHRLHSLSMSSLPFPECREKFHQSAESFQPDVVGFNIITDSRVSAFKLMRETESRYPNTTILAGGIHVTSMHEQIVRTFPKVIAVIGEGELTTRELLACLESGGDLHEVDGIAFFDQDKQRVVVTSPRALIEDLDTLPFPQHEIFFEGGDRTEAQLMTSRGCPFHCTFCALDALSRREVRFRSVQNVVDEIEEIQRRFPQVKSIQIYDDQFFISNKRAIAICDEIVRRGIKLMFLCQGRMRPVSRELVEALERAGFNGVTLGLETGSPSVLKKCKKKITPKDALHAMEMFKNSSINLNVLLMIGLPGESIHTIMETATLVQQMQAIRYHDYSHRIQTTFIYPGTELYRIAKRAGTIDDDFWLTEQNAPYFLVEHTLEEMQLYREILLTHIASIRIFTPGGLAAQKASMGNILREAFNKPLQYPHLTNLVYIAVNRLIVEDKFQVNITNLPQQEGALNILKMMPNSGRLGVFDFYCEPSPEDRLLTTIVEQFYRADITSATTLITQEVIDYLEEVFATGTTQQMNEQLGLTDRRRKDLYNL
ncbi:MAG: B12-binding domain-containing radical SAM protein [Magnetococcales bacterium]|nr:B12-binding domain-containing radical SAM protein [Magnetococcales bacterium]